MYQGVGRVSNFKRGNQADIQIFANATTHEQSLRSYLEYFQNVHLSPCNMDLDDMRESLWCSFDPRSKDTGHLLSPMGISRSSVT